MLKRAILFITISLLVSTAHAKTDPRLVIHLLDYVATDYEKAVVNGEIVNEFEYNEMKDFANSINSLLAELESDTAQLLSLSRGLIKLIDEKTEPTNIAAHSNKIKRTLIALAKVSLAPAKWPNITKGKNLYAVNCSNCHGSDGDGKGPSAAELEPKPTDFTNLKEMGAKSPLQAFHTIRFGVEGTLMLPFNRLSDDEVWDLAFYISTLRYKGIDQVENQDSIGLEQIASHNDNELLNKIEGLNLGKLSFWRNHLSIEKTDASPLLYAKEMLLTAQQLAADGYANAAVKASLNAYLEGVEPIELHLSANNPKLVQRIELELGALRKLYANGSNEQVQSKTNEVLSLLDKAKEILDDKKSSWWLTFSMAVSVILREGLEAFLIIVIILSVLKKAGANTALKYVHGGWISAIGLGVIGWFSTDQLMKMSGMQRELLEGLVAIIAVVILFYIGFWMHSKSEAQKWNEYIKNKIQKLINKQSMIGLGALAFLVVFREAFESVLFLSAINIDDAEMHSGAIGLGVLVAFGLVAILAVLMMRFSKKLPISQLFKFSAIIIAILSVILIGKGVHSLQEAGYIGISAFPVNIRISLLGIFPTIQSIIAQLIMIAITIAVWKWQNRIKPAPAKAND